MILNYRENNKKNDRKTLEQQYYEDLKEDTYEKVHNMGKGFNIMGHIIYLFGSAKDP